MNDGVGAHVQSITYAKRAEDFLSFVGRLDLHQIVEGHFNLYVELQVSLRYLEISSITFPINNTN